jgi:dTDP-4-dehydrorhamnose reductase
MKILVLGTGGMAGHVIYWFLKRNLNSFVMGLNRKQLDVEKDLELLRALLKQEFDVVINCIGLLIKDSELDPIKTSYINGIFPHYLEMLTENTNTKIIHLSTDCVFKGDKDKWYNEDDFPTETNWYGFTKAIGELNNSKDLTLRLSIIGPELKENGTGLFHWFMTQKGTIKGYSQVKWNGITTYELSKQLHKIIHMPSLVGIYNLAPDFFITKKQLLEDINKVFNKK